MPQLDVSDAILDVDFAEPINVTRRPYTTDNNGQPQISPYTPYPIGVVTQGTPHPFEQTPDSQVGKSMITAHAYNFQFYDVVISRNGQSFQPDLITYNGNIYIVTKVYNWSRYGQGFTMAEAELYNMTEAGK